MRIRYKGKRVHVEQGDTSSADLRGQVLRVKELADRRRRLFRDDDLHFLITFVNDYGSVVTQKFLRDIKPLAVVLVDRDNKVTRVSISRPSYENFLYKVETFAQYIDTIEQTSKDYRLGESVKHRLETASPSDLLGVTIEFPSTTLEKQAAVLEFLRGHVASRPREVILSSVTVGDTLLATARLSVKALNELAEDVETIGLIELLPSFSPGTMTLARATTRPIRDSTRRVFRVATAGGAIGDPESLPVVAILDTGVSRRVPGIEKFIESSLDFSTGAEGPCEDTDGHGTFVAGRVIHGADVTKDPPQARIIPIKVFDEAGVVIQEDVVKLVAESIARFRGRARVFNMSFSAGSPNPSISRLLDAISAEYPDILLVAASGNIPPKMILEALNAGQSYPSYLLNFVPFAPGDCYNVLTVGSYNRYSSNIASKGTPSPFTRTGYAERTKPELLEDGGNLNAIHKGGRVFDLSEKGVGVLSWARLADGTDPAFIEQSGTSFAAPLVASIAAKVFAKYPEARADLVKALLVNSCSPLSDPEQHLEFNRTIQGFGVPDEDRALNSRPWRATLFSQTSFIFDRSGKREAHIYRFNFPAAARAAHLTVVYQNPTGSDWMFPNLPYRILLHLRKPGSRNYRSPRPFDPTKPTRPPYELRSARKDNVIHCVFEPIKGGLGPWEVRLAPAVWTKTPRELPYAIVITVTSGLERQNIFDEVAAFNMSKA